MGAAERITITLPQKLVQDIDRITRNRSRFVLEAIIGEFERRRRDALHTSLSDPHTESRQVEEEGFDDWLAALAHEDGLELIDSKAAQPIRWVKGKGWLKKPKSR